MAERDLFERKRAKAPEVKPRRMPLAARMCPRTPDEFVGQEHFFAQGKLLRRMLE
jgi:putative ATPase